MRTLTGNVAASMAIFLPENLAPEKSGADVRRFEERAGGLPHLARRADAPASGPVVRHGMHAAA